MKNIKEILEKVYTNEELRKSIVPLFIGDPGLGKTVLITEFAKEKGVELVELITSQMSPFEISGIAMPEKDSKKMVYYNFDKLENLKDGDILFFDELLNGNPVVLNACLTILEQRKFISGKPLPDIMIVAAANPQGMTPITPQIKERFVWYNVKFSLPGWRTYMIDKYSITKTIANKLSSLIKNETFTDNNFNTPRSIDKAVNMIIHDVPTPYTNLLMPILSEPIENKLDTPIKLTKDRNLEVNEIIMWIDLIRIKRKIAVKRKVEIIDDTEPEYKLPKKWYIRITYDNFGEIYNSFYKKLGAEWGPAEGYGISDDGIGYWQNNLSSIPPEYNEITLDQFRKYVLKK